MTISTSTSPESADVFLEEPPLARTSMWKELVYQLDKAGDLVEIVADAVDADHTADALDVLEDLGIDDEYATAVLKAARYGDDPRIWARFVRETASQGAGGTTLGGEARSIDDLDSSALPLFAASSGPTVALGLPDEWRQRADVQRRRWLELVMEIGAAIDVELVISSVERAHLLDRHSEDLSASLVNSLQQTAPTGPDRVARVAERVRDAPARRVLHALRESPQEVLPLSELQSHVYTRDVSRSANSHRVSMLVEHDLVDRREYDDESHVVLLPLGARVLDTLEEDDLSPSSEYGGSNAVSPDGGLDADASIPSESGQDAAVNNPPKLSTGPCTPAGTREAPSPSPDSTGPDRTADPTAEAAALTAEEPPERETDGWAPLWWQHAVDSVTGREKVALVDEPLTDELPDRVVSHDRDRDVAVVGIEADSTIARTAARLGAALSDDRLLNSVLREARVGDSLEELAIDDPVVRRLASQLGWHGKSEENRRAYRNRLRAAGAELLSDASSIGSGDSFDSDLASEVLRTAHGLIGTIVRLFDLAGVEVRVEFRNDWREWSHRGLNALRRFVGQATAISTVHGAYPLFRCMIEQRENKREVMLGAPTAADGKGESLLSWCLRGPGASRSKMTRHLDYLNIDLNPVGEGARNYAEFAADLDVTTTGREEVAAVATRLLSYKSLTETRESVSLLHGLSSGPFATAQALYGLGSETKHPDRSLRVDEVQLALGMLDSRHLVPDLDSRSNSRAAGAIVSTLLTTEKDLSLSELADAAGVTTQTARNRVDELEALGLLEREDLGAGRATLHRLGFGSDDDGPRLPELVEDDHMSYTDAAQQVLAQLTDYEFSPAVDADSWSSLVLDGTGSIYDLIPDDRDWDRLLDIAVRLVDSGPDDRVPSPLLDSVKIGKRPSIGQTSLVDGGFAGSNLG